MTSPAEELLADLLVRWEERRAAGREPSVAELASERPDLAPELARRIEILRAMDWLDEPLGDEPATPPEIGSPADRDRRPASPRLSWRLALAAGGAVGLACVSMLVLRGWSGPEAADHSGGHLLEPPDADQAFFHARYAEAEDGYTAILEARPDDHRALLGRGVSRLKLGRLEEAVADFSAALDGRPADPEALRQRAQALIYLERYDEAIADLERLVATGLDADRATRQLAAVRKTRAAAASAGSADRAPVAADESEQQPQQ